MAAENEQPIHVCAPIAAPSTVRVSTGPVVVLSSKHLVFPHRRRSEAEVFPVNYQLTEHESRILLSDAVNEDREGRRRARAPTTHTMYRTVLLALLAGSSTSLRVPGRRRAIALAVGAVAGSQSNALPALAADSKPVKVYFGAGCFWHVQHELTMEEMSTLKRSSSQISAVSGYAGGQRLGDGGKVCCELKAAQLHGPSRRHSAACLVRTLIV